MRKPFKNLIGFIVVSILILVIVTMNKDAADIVEDMYTSKGSTMYSDVETYSKVDIESNNSANISSIQTSLSQNKDIDVVLGGNCIGVKLSSEGVLVVGFSEVYKNEEILQSPAKEAGVEIGDIITKVDNVEIKDCKTLIDYLEDNNNNTINVEVKRENNTINKKISLVEEKDNKYKIGLWVRDSTAGVGTLTFYHEETHRFGALGHPVTDVDTNKAFNIKDGKLLDASIISIKKGEKGSPGELKGMFIDSNKPIGTINKNTNCGIFGSVYDTIDLSDNIRKIKVGFRNEIELGKASIIATIDNEGPKEYDIEIVKLYDQDKPSAKSMIIKVTDKELLERTGGIVQGMSGSPIIQNGKLVGAVTHVLINKPDVGYGIYIDWMLKDSGVIE